MSETSTTEHEGFAESLARFMNAQKDRISELEQELAAANKRLEALAFDAARVEWKYGRNDDGTPKNWTEWNNLRESLGEHVRQPQELDPNEARH